MTKDQPLTYRPDIDGLRAIAILLVVAFHYYPHWIEGSKFIQGGFIGVDIFFVISGFLITSIISKEITSNTFSIKSFYVRRIRRIFPALLIMLTSILLFGWYVLLPDEFRMLSKHVLGESASPQTLFYGMRLVILMTLLILSHYYICGALVSKSNFILYGRPYYYSQLIKEFS